MKFILNIFTVILLSAVQLFAQTPTTQVEFTPMVWDFGAIRELDGSVSHTFTYRNTGDKPYIIYEIATSCGCTTPTYDRSPLLPGKQREMKIVFDPTNQPGRIEKTILVRGNVEGGTTVLKIRATVEPRPRTIEDDYPVALTDGLRLQDIVLEIGTSPNSKASTATLGVVNTNSKSVQIEIDKSHLPQWVEVKPQNPTLQPNQKSNIVVTLKPNDKMWGRHAFTMPILVNARAQYLNPTVSTIFVEDFPSQASTAKQPRASFSTYFYHFSNVKQNQAVNYKFTIKNIGAATLHLRHFDHSDNVDITADKISLEPNQMSTVTITPKTNNLGRLNELIRIITNDQFKPVQEFRAMVNVVER